MSQIGYADEPRLNPLDVVERLAAVNDWSFERASEDEITILATGPLTSDALSGEIARLTGPTGEVVLCDINASMLNVGRDRLTDEGLVENLRFVQGNAECLPFPDEHFDLKLLAMIRPHGPDEPVFG